MEIFLSVESWIAFSTLVILEIILGIDNIIFIVIITHRLPKHQQAFARRMGLVVALVGRLLLILLLFWLVKLTTPFVTLVHYSLSVRDVILILGGSFLIWKATHEIHALVESIKPRRKVKTTQPLWNTLAQIAIIDMIFSLDSILTAIGMVKDIEIMIAAIVAAIIVMVIAINPIGDFVQKHPTIKMLALAMLFLIGIALIADAMHFHIPRGYIYFAVLFSLGVEALNLYRAYQQKRRFQH